MKKIILLFAAIVISAAAMAQKELAFPFQGGQEVMSSFFADNFIPSNTLRQQNAAGVVILKFTADLQGNIKKIIVYYADDIELAQPVADVLKKSDHKWIIPDQEKLHDFVLTVNVAYTLPAGGSASAKKKFNTFYNKRSPLLTNNQIPLDMATLLPTLTLKYDASL